jgi:STAS-like domain of unknown function (DUF4325)
MTAKNEINLKVRDDFSRTPGPRLEIEGDFSGEVFRKICLLPKLQQAITSGSKLVVDLDGTAGYGTSFLEEAFGGLIREDGITYDVIKKYVNVISTEEDYLIEDIEQYLTDASRNTTR